MKTAEVISVGTELLLGSTIDTNAAELGELLARCGIACTQRQTVGDNLARLTSAIELALSRSDIVVLIGGLGPTEDDLTRQGIANATHRPLWLDPALEKQLRELFESRGLKWVDSQSRQAERPEGSESLENRWGTAPGIWLPLEQKIVIALPGPPREFRGMMRDHFAERFSRLSEGQVIHSRTLRICGMGEGKVESEIKDLLSSEQPTLAPYAKTAEVHIRITAKAASVDEAIQVIEPMATEVRHRLGWHVYGEDETTLEAQILRLMSLRKESLSVAESLTGGEVMQRLTSVPGASEWFRGGVVAYQYAVKTNLLGVSESELNETGAVTASVAEQMTVGICKEMGTQWGVATTGVAGPGPDSRGVPVGTVFCAVASPAGVEVAEHRFGSDRSANRQRAAQAALTLLYRQLCGIKL